MSEPANSESGTGRYDKDVRARMVTGALRLLATKGLEGTTFGEVLEATGAPRGWCTTTFLAAKWSYYMQRWTWRAIGLVRRWKPLEAFRLPKWLGIFWFCGASCWNDRSSLQVARWSLSRSPLTMRNSSTTPVRYFAPGLSS